MFAWLWAGAALATDVRIEASVADDLRTVTGTMQLPETLVHTLVDPLALLPDPGDDLQGQRTFPGAADHGRVTWEHIGEGRITFHTRLPRRYGAVGATGHGLFANGAWYPQPLVDDGLPEVVWSVELRLPPDSAGAVGDAVGEGEVAWSGVGERASIAVVPRGRITPLTADAHDVVLLTRGRPGRYLVHELEAQLALLPGPLAGTVVEAPQRRRLVRHGPGLAYVSDRAFRLTAGVRFAHRRAVARGLATALVDLPDPFEREVAGAALAQVHSEALTGIDADRLLGTFRWVPSINALLSSGRTAYFTEILDRTHPGDPVLDDLCEILDPYTPGSATVAQLDDRYGPGTGRCVGQALFEGTEGTAAVEACGVDAAWFDAWRGPYPRQDYVLSVKKGTVTIDRRVAPDAPVEALVVRVDGEPTTLLMASGPTTLDLETTPRRVVLDPERHVSQTSRRGDAWPPRYDVTLAAWLGTINLSDVQLFGTGLATLRRLDDTHNLLVGSVSNSRTDLVGVDLAYIRKEGARIDGFRRPHRVRVGVGAALLNPNFAETDGLRVALDNSLSYAHDTRVSGDFPLRGHRVGAAVGVGALPDTWDTWGSVSGHAIGVVALHPRHALAGRSTVAMARSGLPHRLLTLGGSGAMRSIPSLPACPLEGPPLLDDDGNDVDCTVLATERGVAMVEYRWAPIRGWSVPGLLGWATELQLTGGFEGMVARIDGAPVWATGVTTGVYGLADALGVETTGMGITVAWPLAWDPLLTELDPSGIRFSSARLYLRFGQAF